MGTLAAEPLHRSCVDESPRVCLLHSEARHRNAVGTYFIGCTPRMGSEISNLPDGTLLSCDGAQPSTTMSRAVAGRSAMPPSPVPAMCTSSRRVASSLRRSKLRVIVDCHQTTSLANTITSERVGNAQGGDTLRAGELGIIQAAWGKITLSGTRVRRNFSCAHDQVGGWRSLRRRRFTAAMWHSRPRRRCRKDRGVVAEFPRRTKSIDECCRIIVIL